MPGTYIQLLLRGLLAGLVAGLLAGGVAFVVGEPHIESAIALEEAAGEAHSHDHAATTGESHGHSHGEDALVDRTGQKAGLFLATTLAGLALGALYASVLHFARRLTDMPGWKLGLFGAAGAWLAVEAVPFVKYPANPPAVGDPDTIDQRTLLWLASVVLGLVAIAVAVAVAKALAAQDLHTVRIAGPAVAFLVVVGLGYLALPSIDEVGEGFPATLLWEFRVASFTVQLTLWVVLGVVFAYLTERASRRVTIPA
ncbi:membrane protein [Rhodococcus pyridinivorans KG-16]|uniref:Membrane protein n=1 Tax=Rhodococcus pyridinivorans KG-16 TaxID=1441730 RepID=A0A0V9US29_9NOCA|nr:CbtA family protein [Rhodococcus pyridinivorans]KSZ60784.1 membrane protein [Rhodococcus pyridinivorans KG-16]